MRINLSSNTDILAATPTLFGFVPTNSIVAIVLDNIGDRHTVYVSARYDIAEPLEAAAQLANTLPLQQPGGCGSPEIVEGFLCRFGLGLGFPDLVVDGR
ncbi:DUF4192 family protein [Mycolicibacterium vinylchloridicum]|uniref:DUF4192 family protein n=1 Tax=Mycolicibacterium vinylchloridicum TaxID=2736928 RepID=UPI0015CB30B5|nr:DUF4192 family protein [Mycolicibacterium vinylchloridicum]